MPRKGENVFHRKDGRWEARYVKGYGPNGSKVYGSVYAKTYSEVKQKRIEKLKKIDMNQLIRPTEYFEFYAKAWLEFCKLNLKDSTLTKYQVVINNYILPFFSKMKIDLISTKDINDFIFNLINKKTKKGKPLAAKTTRDILQILNNIFSFIQINYNIKINAIIIRPKLQSTIKSTPTFSKNDIKKLLTVLNTDVDDDLCKLGTMLALITGMRVGEVSALKWYNINLEEKYIYVEKTMQRVKNFDENIHTKTRVIETSPKSASSIRKIPISESLFNILVKHKRKDNCYLLSGLSDKFVEPTRLQAKFKKYLKLAGIENGHFHMLRHTFATICVENNMNVKILSQVLGHSNIQITLNRYSHPDYSVIEKFMEQSSEIIIDIN